MFANVSVMGLPLLEFDHRLKTNRWIVKRPIYLFADEKSMSAHTEMRSDLASIPKLIRTLFPIDGRHVRAAILHDAMYRWYSPFNRAEADWLFYTMMMQDGVPRWRAELMYQGVRAGGWMTWNRYHK